ncbi:T9SS type B sorting domain-containing protein [Paucihalobacter ruber]|uniref:T9SS type B sorting domain-containing protein n=2 Tax=Paucihalobacter ruber TaxID=2567861 RepID=A0A506PMF5_9FLAO|nr:T9SS type B sorting domain-containing protein [Paucihalobacter ruber]
MKFFFVLVCTILLHSSTFGQIILTQTHSDATIGLDRKAFLGLGNTSQSSDGYAHDFTLPERTSSCERISAISVVINLTSYTNNSLPGCPPITLYYNLFYGCGTYSGGATCLPATNLIAEPNFAPNTSPPTFNFGNPLGSPLNANIEPDFGDNLSVDIIPVSNPGCNSVSNGRISYEYTITVTVSVEEVPDVSPTFTQVPAICEGEALSALPTTSENGITGTWSPALDNTTTTEYTFTPDAGQCASTQTMTITVNPATTPTFTQRPAICEGETLSPLPTTSENGITGTWSPALDNSTTTEYTFTPDTGQCARTQTMTITVNPATTPTFTQIPAICQGETLSPLPTTSENGITGTWSPALDNTTTTEYTFTPDTGQCASIQTITITVNPATTPTFTQVSAICEGETLSPLPTTSENGISGTWSPALDDTTTTEYTFTPDTGQCASIQTITITVNPATTPTFTQVSAICEGETLSPLPTTSENGITGTWSPALDNSTTTEYTFTPDTGQCARTQTMTITVNPATTPTFTQRPAICQGETISVLPTTSENGITGTWSPALDNSTTTEYTFTPDAGQCASNQTMTITVNPATTPTFTQVPAICQGETISVLPTTSENGITGTWSPALDNSTTTEYTFTPDAGQCATIQTMTITVNPVDTLPTFTQVPAICEGETVSPLPTTSENGITGTWSPALDNSTTTEYTFTPDAGQCASTQTMTIVVNINTAPVISEVKTNGFDIEIITSETGDFSYSIDGRNFQYGNIFYGIRGGRYSITVRDNSGCGQDVLSHLHFVIPKFFTPNNDGFNDFFEIRGIQEFGNSEVNIFDRFGKLLKSYRNSPVVWDGTYLGNLLPTNDYWYQIIIDGEEFTGHFTLKR